MATRCFCPPDRLLVGRSASAASPTWASASRAAAAAAALDSSYLRRPGEGRGAAVVSQRSPETTSRVVTIEQYIHCH